MFLDNTFKSKKNGIFGAQKPSTPHHLLAIVFFAAGIRSTGVEIQIRRVDEHSSQLWASYGLNGVGLDSCHCNEEPEVGSFSGTDPKSHPLRWGRLVNTLKICLACGTRK